MHLYIYVFIYSSIQYKAINYTEIINYKFYTHVHCRYSADQIETVFTKYVLELLLYKTYTILKYVQYFSFMRK